MFYHFVIPLWKFIELKYKNELKSMWNVKHCILNSFDIFIYIMCWFYMHSCQSMMLIMWYFKITKYISKKYIKIKSVNEDKMWNKVKYIQINSSQSQGEFYFERKCSILIFFSKTLLCIRMYGFNPNVVIIFQWNIKEKAICFIFYFFCNNIVIGSEKYKSLGKY